MTEESDKPPDIKVVEELLARLVTDGVYRLKAMIRMHPMVTFAVLHEHVRVNGEEKVYDTKIPLDLVVEAHERHYLCGRPKEHLVSYTELVLSAQGARYLERTAIG